MLTSNVAIQEETLTTEDTREFKLIQKAESVFSKGYIQALMKNGLDLIESDSYGAFLRDSQGNDYLDCYTSGGMYNLGRKNEEISKALLTASQETDQGNFVAVSEEKALLAERLSQFTPEGLDCFLFTVVRGEAMDAACKLARGFTERQRLITVDGGRYGDTGFALSLSDTPLKQKFGELIPAIDSMTFNDMRSAVEMIDKSCAAVILEPVQAENGCREADAAWLKTVRETCDETGALLIFDETQTGFGRTGKRFASELYGVTPDIMVFGEALTGGVFPMTGIAFTKKVKHFFDVHPLIHLCTFGGHDIGCRTGIAALDLYDRVRPWENAAIIGQTILKKLNGVADACEAIKSIQGTGLLLSLSFKTISGAESFCRKAKEQGVIVKQGEVAPESVIIRPVLTLSDNEAELLTERLISVLQNF